MKIETITPDGHSSFVTNHTVYVDISIGDFKRHLCIEADGRIFDETIPDDTKEI